MNRATRQACVIGWPIEHSRSPLIHGYWLKKYGIDGRYTKEAVEPQNLEQFLRSLKARGFAGCNVTVPHKEHAFVLCDERSVAAENIGAVNTIVVRDGKLFGHNTDQFGFMQHFVSSAPSWTGHGPVSILGAGGAAKAIVSGFAVPTVHAAVDSKTKLEIRVINRSRVRAEEIAGRWDGLVTVHDWSDRIAATREARVIINTTVLGMHGSDPLEFAVDHLRDDCIVADIVYVPLETELLRRARARGLETVDGLGMLLHQAVPGFEAWFGIKPEVTPELRALIEADIKAHASC
jgi:shikimate dehydrogenase